MGNKDTQIQAADLNQLQQIGEFGVNELMTMKETIGKDLSIPQFNLFMYQCNRMGLDPALKHAFPILYGGKLDSRVSYEGLLSLAKKSDGYQGVFNQVVCENEIESFEAETDDEGVIVKIYHKVKFPRGKVVAAYSIAKREGHKPVIVLMDVMEVQKLLKGQNQKFWKMDDGSPDPDMFKKHVGFRSIKAQYDIASVVEDNMESLNATEGSSSTEPQRRDITSEATEIPSTKPGEDAPQETKAEDEGAKIKALKVQMKQNYTKLGITEMKEKEEHMGEFCKIKGETPTLAEITAYLKIMDLQIQEKQAAEQANDDLPL
ncbi:recombinase RecT [Paenibacillus dokdonensis]|uniref:Recombinase RecT n=1 Tax=Paenibacillus dokdonensis TaxID=2567944 RepID=A0ABU6GMI8_9BACL|nr:recombinase RecT [Paenibacillus dokdonensis]MEC0239456.1 recombinase RecT [Paenibacillus dokdonensis]